MTIYKFAILIILIVFAGCRQAPASGESDLYAAAAKALSDGDYAEAMGLASDALESDEDDAEQRARAMMIMSAAHAAAGNGEASLAYAREAVFVAPEFIEARRGLVDAASRVGDYHLAIDELDSIHVNDSAGVILSIRQSVEPALGLGYTERAFNALKTLYSDSLWLPAKHLVALAEIYRKKGYPDSAEIVMAGLEEESMTTESDLRAIAHYYMNRGDEHRAITAWERQAAVQDSVLRTLSASSIYGKLYTREHGRRLEIAELSRINRLRLTIVIIAVSGAFLVILSLFLYMRSRQHQRILEAENRLLMADEELRALSERSRSTIGRLFRESHDSIELAANMLIDSSASSNVAANIRARLEKQVEACRSPKFLADLEREADLCHEGAVSLLRERLSGLSQSELAVALYCAAGLSPRVICLLLDCTPSALYNKKYRLKGKIRACGAPAEEVEKLIALVD